MALKRAGAALSESPWKTAIRPPRSSQRFASSDRPLEGWGTRSLQRSDTCPFLAVTASPAWFRPCTSSVPACTLKCCRDDLDLAEPSCAAEDGGLSNPHGRLFSGRVGP